MIYEGSRYQTSTVQAVADNAGVYHATIIPRRPPAPSTDYTTHRVVYGDRLDLLALRAYGDAELWWQIADANPELNFPDDLTLNTIIKIPRAVGL